jgi:predicted GH43/DUF377 family glycosyl hydrolase
MRTTLVRSVQELGDGTTVLLDSRETVFKLDSYEKNPVVKPQDIGLTWTEDGKSKIGAVFNGGAELFQDKVILTPRCHRNYEEGTFFDHDLGRERHCLENYISEVWPLVSEDGIHFKRFNNVVIRGDGTDHQDFIYGIEDIRIIQYPQMYLLGGCGKIKPPFKGKNADRIAIYSTKDFVNITYHGMVESFDSRNAIPFTDYIGGKLYILLRFHPNIHLDLLEAGMDQLLNPSLYEDFWRKIYERQGENLLLEAGSYPHEKEKVGPSTQIIKTDKGWLVIYHAVGEMDLGICKEYGLSQKIERGYSICAALLDLEDPKKVLCRTKNPIYIPSAPYELYGNDQYPVDVPAVVFPTGAITIKNKLLIYCGAGDKYVILLTCDLGNLLDHLWVDCRI